MILEHPANIQIFKYDECKSIDEFSAFLMGKISAPVGYALVYARDHFAPLPRSGLPFMPRSISSEPLPVAFHPSERI